MGTRSQNTNTPPKPSYFSPNSALELAAGESGLKASGNSGEVPKRSSGLLNRGRRSFPWRKGAGSINLDPRRFLGANDLITTASSWFVGQKEQRKVIRDFEAVRLQLHNAVGIVFNQEGCSGALSKHDRGHTSERVAGCRMAVTSPCKNLSQGHLRARAIIDV